jgi:uncharacterized Fe-S radical SAM superfamily protein PflX
MRQDIFAQLDRRTKSIYVDEDFVFDYCHDAAVEEIGTLLKAARSSWDELLEICAVCPEQCIAERESPSSFFDRLV